MKNCAECGWALTVDEAKASMCWRCLDRASERHPELVLGPRRPQNAEFAVILNGPCRLCGHAQYSQACFVAHVRAGVK